MAIVLKNFEPPILKNLEIQVRVESAVFDPVKGTAMLTLRVSELNESEEEMLLNLFPHTLQTVQECLRREALLEAIVP